MKITKSQLQRIIQEELQQVMMEGEPDPSSLTVDRKRRRRPALRGQSRHAERFTYDPPVTAPSGQPIDIYGNIKQAGVDYTDPRRAPTEAGRQGRLTDEDRPETYQGATTMAIRRHRRPSLPGEEEQGRGIGWREYPTGIPGPERDYLMSDEWAVPSPGQTKEEFGAEMWRQHPRSMKRQYGSGPQRGWKGVIQPVDESLINELTEAVLAKLTKR